MGEVAFTNSWQSQKNFCGYKEKILKFSSLDRVSQRKVDEISSISLTVLEDHSIKEPSRLAVRLAKEHEQIYSLNFNQAYNTCVKIVEEYINQQKELSCDSEISDFENSFLSCTMSEFGAEEIANLRANVKNLVIQLNQLQASLKQIRLAVTGRTNNENVASDHVNPIIQTHKMDLFSEEKETFPSYLQKFNAYCRLSSIPDDQKLDTLILYLREKAMDLLMASENAINSFAEAVSFLERNFKESTSLAEEIGKLIDQIYVTDSDDIRLQKKLTIISFLLPLELRTTLEFMNVDVFETAIRRGHKMWMNYEQAKKDKTRENKLYKENRRFQGKCSNCNKEEHIAKNCRLLKNNKNVFKNNSPTAKG
uniref:CCHC-type domain-containing protein n=1 Tax=Strongyloides venezuelensis TaxID=75913 RepID=A0A0K0FXC4_STRVS